MSAKVYHLDFGGGGMQELSRTALLPVGSLVSYGDMANPRAHAVVIGAEVGEFSHGQECISASGQRSFVHATDPDRYGRDSAGGWHFVRDEHDAPRILSAEEIAAFIAQAAETKRTADLAAARAADTQAAKDAADRARYAAEFAFLKRSEPNGKRGHALASANLKKLLAVRFPGQVFSVTSDSYAGGNSVRVGWTDGPTHDEVDALADRFQEADFDGMDDSTHYRHNIFAEMFGGAKYVNCSRSISNARRIEVAASLGYSVTFGPRGEMLGSDHDTQEMIYRETRTRSFYVPPTAPVAVSCDLPAPASGVTVRINPEKNGVEIVFPAKPAADVLDRVKAAGFRWSRFAGCWWAKQSADTLAAAQAIAGQTLNA